MTLTWSWLLGATRVHRHLCLIRNDQRGTVAVLAALAMPVCVGVMALGIDVSNWAMTRVQLQRLADIAAMAGASRYAETLDGPAAVTSAANVAELNGVPAGTRTGSFTTMLTDNYGDWTTSYAFSSVTTTITVTVRTQAPIWFGRLFTSATKQPIAAVAVAQIFPRTSGGQACVLGLKGDSTGITTFVDLSISGNTSVTSKTCGVRSDGSLQVNGNASLQVPTVVASGTISVGGNGSITCPSGTSCQQGGDPQVPDPFYTAYNSQIGIPATGNAGIMVGTTLNPGLYSSAINLGGNDSYTLSPGTYYVNGSISISGNASVSGSGVTLISSGGISISGNGTGKLMAPMQGATAGLLYGTSSSSASVSLSGNSRVTLNGAVYAPNVGVSFSGNSSVITTQSTCLNIVAATVSFSGNSDFTNTGCAALGVPAVYNLPPIARLIQ
jgi:Flp pilus assembly protein TadG